MTMQKTTTPTGQNGSTPAPTAAPLSGGRYPKPVTDGQPQTPQRPAGIPENHLVEEMFRGIGDPR